VLGQVVDLQSSSLSSQKWNKAFENTLIILNFLALWALPIVITKTKIVPNKEYKTQI
jgi:hypothetical protein